MYCYLVCSLDRSWIAKATFGNTALETGIEGVTREEGEQLRLAGETFIIAVVIAHSLEPCDTSNRFC